MRRMKNDLVTLIIILFMLGGCTAAYELTEFGNEAEIEFKNGNEINCEIVFLTDSTIIFSPITNKYSTYRIQQKQFYISELDKIESIKINGFDGKEWPIAVIFGQVIPSVLFTIAAATAGADVATAFGISIFPAGVTSLLYLASEAPTPEWNEKDTTNKVQELQIYSRFPNGLNENNLKKLMSAYQQANLIRYQP